jgi:rRNA maturation protein Rpf1
MGVTSNESKQRWNKKHYTQVKVSVPHEIAEAFKSRCVAADVSIASEITNFMRNSRPKKTGPDVTTRQKRRKAVLAVILQVEAVADAEQEYMENIPINLQNSERYEAAEQAVSALEEALCILHNIYT